MGDESANDGDVEAFGRGVKGRRSPPLYLQHHITEIEGILNRRPLTQISTNSKDTQALMPNHFLALTSAVALTKPVNNLAMAEADMARFLWKKSSEPFQFILENIQR